MANQSTEQLAAQKRAKTDKRRYVKLRLKNDPVTCVVEPHEAIRMMSDDPDLISEDVWMTVAEFEALPDFGGW